MDTISIYLKDRKDLTKEDFNMIQLSGVTIRGKKQWPVIRVFEPGFPPRLMDEFDLSKIVRVTEVITDYTLYLKENMDKASLLKEGKYILREYDETGSYKEYIKKYDDFFSTHSEAYEMPILYHEIDLKRILKNCKKTRNVWEVDSFYYPTTVEDEGEIFYPAILMVVDLESKIIVGQHLTHPNMII